MLMLILSKRPECSLKQQRQTQKKKDAKLKHVGLNKRLRQARVDEFITGRPQTGPNTEASPATPHTLP